MEHRTLGQIDAIGVDENQYAKGHKHLTLVYHIDIGISRLLWVDLIQIRMLAKFTSGQAAIHNELLSLRLRYRR